MPVGISPSQEQQPSSMAPVGGPPIGGGALPDTSNGLAAPSSTGLNTAGVAKKWGIDGFKAGGMSASPQAPSLPR